MIIVLKVILSLFMIAIGIVSKFVFDDFNNVRKTEGYDNISVWQKLKFMTMFCAIETSLVSLIVFLGYFVIVSMQIL